MQSGWIKLHRQLLEKAIWQCSTMEQKVILITLLMMASHKENSWEWQGKQYIIQPGQFVTSLNSIAEKAGPGISIQNVRTALDKLERYNFLTNQSTKTGRLITIVNWELYQSGEPELTKVLTINQQRPNKELTTINNDKNDKNNNIVHFESFWSLYPKKTGKQSILKSASKLTALSKISIEEMQRAIDRYKKEVEKERSTGFQRQYKDGGTWFNGAYMDYMDSSYKDTAKDKQPKLIANDSRWD